MAKRYEYDLFVIGGGSGGVRAARVAAELGARVGIAEQDRFGGTCVIRGCVPKKYLVYASAFAEEFADAAGYGWTVEDTRFDWPTLIANKDRQLVRLEGYYRKAVERTGGTIFNDRALIADPHTIHLVDANIDITTEHILVATGGRPSRNTGAPGTDLCITSDEAFHLKELPKRILIIGGGYIALEFAHIFHGLGSEVTVAYRGPKVLRGFDEDVRDALEASMRKRGIKLLLGTVATGFASSEKGLHAVMRSGDVVAADTIMLAIGRLPNTAGFGLEEAGVTLTARGHIEVDRYSRSSVPSIYAVGDVTGRMELTPVAIHEAMCFARTVFGADPAAPDHDLVATAVFTRPEIGTVGLTEEAALERGHTIDIFKTSFLPMKNTLSGRDERMLMKLVVDASTDRVLGCHIFGPEAGEMVQLAAIPMKMGATKAQFDAVVAVHPTMAEELVTIRTKAATREPGQ